MTTSRSEHALTTLREAIFAMRLAPGEALAERAIAKRFKLGRAELRAALRRLKAEGLIRTMPGKGPTVAPVTRQEVVDIFDLRKALDVLICELFVDRASPQERSQLVACVKKLERARQDEDMAAMTRGTGRFYEILIAGSRNPVAALLSATLRASVLRMRVTLVRNAMASPSSLPRVRKSIGRMLAIAQAAQKRNAGTARRKMAAHIAEQARFTLDMITRKTVLKADR